MPYRPVRKLVIELDAPSHLQMLVVFRADVPASAHTGVKMVQFQASPRPAMQLLEQTTSITMLSNFTPLGNAMCLYRLNVTACLDDIAPLHW